MAFWSLHLFTQSYWGKFEMACIGRSLALGHGFSSPWVGDTGPTAWTAPLYPWIVSLVFRVFGVYSNSAAVVLLTFNSIFSALTCWVIYRIGCRLFNREIAAWSGWVWVLSPYAIYWSITWIWETTLSAFLLSLLFLLTLEMDADARLWPWFRYGLLWGIVALVNTSLVSWLPFSGCWLAWRLYRGGRRFIMPVVLSAVVFWAVITPWIVRNYVVFDKIILVRGDLGSELRAGNNPLATGWWVWQYRAGNNPTLLAEYARMGEVAYDAEQTRLAKQWIAENPGKFVELSGRKFLNFWLAAPEPPFIPLKQAFLLALTPLSIAGLIIAWRQHVHGVFLFASLVIFYPLIYYITFPTDRYHHVIEPELILLAVYCVVKELASGKSRGDKAAA